MNVKLPNPGDLLACEDGDIGIVLDSFVHIGGPKIKVLWSNGTMLIDWWDSEDFSSRRPTFRVINKA